MTTLEKMDALCDEMDDDTTISEICALLDAMYRITNNRKLGHTESTMLYMARDCAEAAQDNFNAYTRDLFRLIKEAQEEASADRGETKRSVFDNE